MDVAAEILYEYLRDVMYAPAHAKLDIERLPDEFKALGRGLIDRKSTRLNSSH